MKQWNFKHAWLLLLLIFGQSCWADFYVSKVSESSYDNSPALIIRFTSALSAETQLDNYVSVSPSLENGSRWLTVDDGYSWILPFVEPNTLYQVTFKQKPISIKQETLKTVTVDKSTNKHGSSDKWSVTTSPIEPAANFAQNGQYLTQNAENALPVTVVNIDSLTLDIFRVRDDQQQNFLNQTFYSGRLDYSSLTNLKKWADLVHTANYNLDIPRHKRDTINLDITPATEKHENGIYIAVLRKPGVYEYRYDTNFFTRSDIGLHSRFMGDEIQTMTHTISSGQPMPNVDLTYLWKESGKNNFRSSRETTNDLGINSKKANQMPDLIIARVNNQVSFLRSSQNKLDLSAFPNVPARHQALQAFLYGPRDLYRPGETVNINMLLRDYDGNTSEQVPVTAELFDARGSRIENFTWWNDASGSYQHSFTLDSDAPTGDWRLKVGSTQSLSGEYTFKVEEFLPERLSMTFYDGAIEQYRYLDKRSGSVPINAQYLYGAPAAGNRADAIVTASTATNLFKQWENYHFGDPSERIYPKTKRLSEIKLDDAGDGLLTLPNDWSNIKTPINVRVTASVYEEGGRPITRSQTLVSLPTSGSQFVGIHPQFKDNPKSNQTVVFDLISVDRNGIPLADTVDVKLIRKNRDYYWYYDDDNGWNWRWRNDAYVSFAQKIEIDPTGTTIELPLQWGDYELEVISNAGTKTVYPFRTQYSWGNRTANALRPDVIDIILDQDHYLPGTEALVRFQSANQGTAILQVESSDGVLYSQTLQAIVGENTASLLVKEQWDRHDLYISIMVLSPADQITEVAPKRTLGIAHLPIRRANAQFEITIEAPEKIEPNQTVSATLKVSNPEALTGNKLWATVALVDMGVLNITNYKTPQPEQFFFAPRRFENRYLDLYGKVINNLGLKLYQQRFGGGFADSDDALTRGGDKPQSEVQIVSFFSQPIEILNGEANVEFELPSFNGRLKWMVVAWTENSYASDEVEMTVADKLVTQLSMPRFLAMGDQSQLTLDLHNLSDQTQELDITTHINGAITSPFQPQTLTLADKEKTSLVIPIKAIDYTGQGQIEINVTNGTDITINRSWKLGIRAPFPLKTQRLRKVINAGEQWKPKPSIDNLLPSTITAQVTISDKPAIDFQGHLDYLLQYPYGCLEQTTSSTYPWILIDSDMFASLNLEEIFNKRFNQPFNDTFRRKQIDNGIERLLKKQQSNGSFGYWNSNSTSSMWGTAYASELLVDAFKLGIAFDKSRLDKALSALSQMVKGNTATDIWTDNDSAYRFSFRAYAAFVLAKADQQNQSDLRRLFEQMKTNSISHSSLPWMHLAAAFSYSGDQQRAKEAAEKALTFKRPKNHYYADYGSDVRDITLTLALAIEHNFDQGALVQDLEEAIAHRRWLSTQERISLLRLGKAFLNDGSSWQAKLVLDKHTQQINTTKPFNSLISGVQLSDLESIKAEDQRLYSTIVWHGVPDSAPTAYENGIAISRQFYSLEGKRLDFSTPLRSGDLVIVRINVQSKEYRFPEALVVDLLPAGLELENQNLLNASVNLDEITIEDRNVGDYFRSYRVDYEEYRDDRYVAAVSLSEWSPTTLFYLARAVTPGVYAVPNSYVEDMYRPEYQSMSQTPGTLTIMTAE